MAKEIELTQEQEDALYAKFHERQINADRIKREKLNLSVFSYGGTVLIIDEFAPKQKIDKKTNVPVLDGNGQPTFWDASYYVELAHLGSSRKFVVPLDLGKDLQKGEDYLFEGDLTDVDNKLKVKNITRI